MIDWKKGKPKTRIDCCLVIYQEDYEFACFDGEKWKICYGDGGGTFWATAEEAIEFYAMLNKPADQTKKQR